MPRWFLSLRFYAWSLFPSHIAAPSVSIFLSSLLHHPSPILGPSSSCFGFFLPNSLFLELNYKGDQWDMCLSDVSSTVCMHCHWRWAFQRHSFPGNQYRYWLILFFLKYVNRPSHHIYKLCRHLTETLYVWTIQNLSCLCFLSCGPS